MVCLGQFQKFQKEKIIFKRHEILDTNCLESSTSTEKSSNRLEMHDRMQLQEICRKDFHVTGRWGQ
jgi:hypothetical protein